MSELLKVAVKKAENKTEIIMTIKDIHPDSGNIQIMLDDREEYQSGLCLAKYALGLLWDREDGSEDSEFIKEYNKAWYLVENGDLEGFEEMDESDDYIMAKPEDIMPSCEAQEDEVVEAIVENAEIVELKDGDFWDNYTGQEVNEAELPTAVIRVKFKNPRLAELFDGEEWETSFDITL